MKTRNIPFYEVQDGVFEIDEFDCASVFVIVGEERALVMDTGCGIGDLRWVIENRITKKPYDVVITHNHGDHIGGAGFFDEVWVRQEDMDWGADFEKDSGMEFRRNYAAIIRRREDKNYPYDEVRDIAPWPSCPVKKEMKDGQVFDLGGRRVTIYHCPGHTDGECIAIDDKSRILFAGDACNRKFLLTRHEDEDLQVCAARAKKALERIAAMQDRYDSTAVYNFHHDYRGFGAPLAQDVLPNLIECLRQMQEGAADYQSRPDDLFPEKEMVEVAVWKNVQILFVNQ